MQEFKFTLIVCLKMHKWRKNTRQDERNRACQKQCIRPYHMKCKSNIQISNRVYQHGFFLHIIFQHVPCLQIIYTCVFLLPHLSFTGRWSLVHGFLFSFIFTLSPCSWLLICTQSSLRKACEGAASVYEIMLLELWQLVRRKFI